jgi:hypothetical protein
MRQLLQARTSRLAVATIMAGAIAATSWRAGPAQGVSTSSDSADPTAVFPGESYSPPLRQPAENNLYWGDLHLHTANSSIDAYMQGTRLVGPAEAYRFAMGEEVVADNGVPAKLRRPLDFLAVTDHSENMGLYQRLDAGDPLIAGTKDAEIFTEFRELVEKYGLSGGYARMILGGKQMPDISEDLARSIWQEIATIADRHNRPGRFTTLIGYEWTALTGGDNLHRVVIYRDDADKVPKLLPIDASKDADPETLWAGLARYEEETGGKVLAIPHNSNLSNGRMFSPTRANGEKFDLKYAEARARWEPLLEVTQVKGDSEAHPTLSPTDEFADFENWDRANIANTKAKEPWMLRYEYARNALLEGLRYEGSLGINPFKLGLIGASDIHTGLSTTEEDNYYGKFKMTSPSPDRIKGMMLGEPTDPKAPRNWELGASGLTAVWAPENTRAAIFDALKRREVYATSGSRIRLRFFGGWNYAKGDIDRPDYARHGYRNGVPMGGDMPHRTGTAAPTFLVHAVRDPDGANLDRIQVVKGWIDAKGESQEKIYDVAMSDGRKPGQRVGSTVDVKKATYRNSIGDPELAAWWSDPDFDASQRAFYYVRVLEIPTPRWTTYDAAFFGFELPTEIPRTVQDRAYSSPIWYRP